MAPEVVVTVAPVFTDVEEVVELGDGSFQQGPFWQQSEIGGKEKVRETNNKIRCSANKFKLLTATVCFCRPAVPPFRAAKSICGGKQKLEIMCFL